MNGAEHYIESERLLKLSSNEGSIAASHALAAQAQVHATLALIAGVMSTGFVPKKAAALAALFDLVTE